MASRFDRGLIRAACRFACALLLAVVASNAGADVTNGSYESGPPNSGGVVMLPSGSTAIDGWVVSQGTIEHVSNIVWQPQDGTRTVALNGTGPGGIAQTFATSPSASSTAGPFRCARSRASTPRYR